MKKTVRKTEENMNRKRRIMRMEYDEKRNYAEKEE